MYINMYICIYTHACINPNYDLLFWNYRFLPGTIGLSTLYMVVPFTVPQATVRRGYCFLQMYTWIENEKDVYCSKASLLELWLLLLLLRGGRRQVVGRCIINLNPKLLYRLLWQRILLRLLFRPVHLWSLLLVLLSLFIDCVFNSSFGFIPCFKMLKI